MRSAIATPKTRYRSVKYKLNRENTTSFNYISEGNSTFILGSNKKKSESVSTHKLNQTTKINRNLELKNIENEEEFNEKQFMKSTYADSFQEILSIEKTKKNKSSKKIETPLKIAGKRDSRVSLPILIQGDSFFTVLDNIHLPIIYIQEEIEKAEKKLKEEEVNIAKIRANFKQINKKITKSIQQTENMGIKGFQKLRALLKSNKVCQQEVSLKLKSSFESSRAYLPEFYEKFEKSKNDVQELQKVIFANTPFELQQKQEFEAISSDYF